MSFLTVAALVLTAALLAVLWTRYASLKREAFIRTSDFPKGLFDRLRKTHPTLSTKDCQLVAHGLRQFFLAHLKSGRAYVSMPSQIVDDLWHEFILYTKNYESYCRRAFGRFLHHTPAAVFRSNRRSNAGLRRCWWYVCKDENINPRAPTRLPLLFALDAKLGIAGGFHYVADCRSTRGVAEAGGGGGAYCGGDFADASIDGSTDGFGAASNDASGNDSSGGDGCGGGGCGGGDGG